MSRRIKDSIMILHISIGVIIGYLFRSILQLRFNAKCIKLLDRISKDIKIDEYEIARKYF